MAKEIGIFESDIVASIKAVGKSFNVKAFQTLMEKFEVKIDEMKAASKIHRVRGTDSEVQSVEMAISAKKLDKIIDKARMSAKRPYLDFNQSLDGMVRPLQKSLTKIEAAERKKCTTYRSELMKKEAEAEALQVKRQKEKINLGGLNIALTPKPTKPAVGKVESYSSATGSGSYKKVPTATLVDIKKVPEKYLEVNWVAVKAAIKDGILNIPGFEIKDEISMTLRS